MNNNTILTLGMSVLTGLAVFSCTGQKGQEQFKNELASIDLARGDIALCGSGVDQFGTVAFGIFCAESVRKDFNMATALLHSFEYTEAEKVFARIIDKDPECVMAYWGAAMCNFHPLWTVPSQAELEKGSKIISLARSIIKDKSTRESDYLEAIASVYDQWNILDHRTRVLKFEKHSEEIFQKYPDDIEASIFYSLALAAAADPADKTFHRQMKAGDILNKICVDEPNHPGIAHYLIHIYDYPELAKFALPTARKYAAVAPASAHAQHMPSHIFIRLGLWDESIQSNLNSVSSAKCYAENLAATGHWDEELHGMDYLLYAYLQKANDDKARELITYLNTIKQVFPLNFKVAYCFASMPARFALERRDWTSAAKLQLNPADFPWEKFPWEKTNIHFARLLGSVHTRKLDDARTELEQIQSVHAKLTNANESYTANLVLIQMKASQGWISLLEGDTTQAIEFLVEAADMEDATAKHPVTPGEIIPARELLGDMYFQIGNFSNALKSYQANLASHPNRFNGLYGMGRSLEKLGNINEANQYYFQLETLTNFSVADRPQMLTLKNSNKVSRKD